MAEALGLPLRRASSEVMPQLGPADPSNTAGPSTVLQLPKPVLACRAIADKDIEPAVKLLSSGFPEREPGYWRRALLRLRDRVVPLGRARYGYVMTDCDRLVGIVLTIFSEADDGEIRGNVSSWYVEPAYRGFSHLLLASTLKLKDVTLFNISPAPNTIETIGAQGFSQYVGGAFQSVAALAPPVRGARVCQMMPGSQNAPAVLTDHAQWGCLSFTVTHGGETYPFVFLPTRLFGDRVPCAQLVYCREVADFVRFAGPLGRRLLRHGLLAVMVDANAPLPGLAGTYRARRNLRFFRGAAHPRVGDLSYTELVIFGP